VLTGELSTALLAPAAGASGILVAVSGGPDSMALFDLAARWRAEAPGRPPLFAATVDHGLRADSVAEAQIASGFAAARGVPHAVLRWEGEKPSSRVQERAREARYRLLADEARRLGADFVLTAHHADDQAETILHRALRGTGVGGLAGMKRARRLVDGVALLRPLLGVRRAALRAWLTGHGQSWREDESNADPRFARARLRTEILPRIEAGAWPGATEALVRLGSQAAVVSGALESAAAHLLERHARPMPGGGVVIEAAAFRGLDAHLLAEVAAALWRREAWPCRDMTARHYREVAALLAAAADADRAPPAAACFPGDVVATVAGTALRVGRIDRSDRAES